MMKFQTEKDYKVQEKASHIGQGDQLNQLLF